uniref:Uncharacterized protein n=1 Tax=Aegilops tauschii subsp. strangulata TaxID=200361 RepID=A0A453MLJ0_AEGTS
MLCVVWHPIVNRRTFFSKEKERVKRRTRPAGRGDKERPNHAILIVNHHHDFP